MTVKEQQIIDGLKPICQCKRLRKSVFLKHIKAGLKTVEELKKVTGAGRGSCNGKNCTASIAEMIKSAR